RADDVYNLEAPGPLSFKITSRKDSTGKIINDLIVSWFPVRGARRYMTTWNKDNGAETLGTTGISEFVIPDVKPGTYNAAVQMVNFINQSSSWTEGSFDVVIGVGGIPDQPGSSGGDDTGGVGQEPTDPEVGDSALTASQNLRVAGTGGV